MSTLINNEFFPAGSHPLSANSIEGKPRVMADYRNESRRAGMRLQTRRVQVLIERNLCAPRASGAPLLTIRVSVMD